jgi:hypothetical protein
MKTTQSIFDFVNATQFLPTFCGIPMTAMTRHKLRGKNGNNRPVDFTDDEKKKITQGIEKLHRMFQHGWTLQHLLDDATALRTNYFRLKPKSGKANNLALYCNVKPTGGAMVVIFRVGKGTGRNAQRWMDPTTPIELVPISSHQKQPA